MRPSRLLKSFVRWVPYADGRRGSQGPMLHPTWPYELWARVFGWENRAIRWLRGYARRV